VVVQQTSIAAGNALQNAAALGAYTTQRMPVAGHPPQGGYSAVVASGTSTAFITEPLAIAASAWFASSSG
jgi:hypothetical protein